jgi:hypothetical protein
MNLRLIEITDRGKPNQERLHLEAIVPVDLQFYIVFSTTLVPNVPNLGSYLALLGPEKISTVPTNVFWFPEYKIARGDHIVLYSGGGIQSKQSRPDGYYDHFFFWGSSKLLWDSPNARATVFEIAGFQTTK